MKAVCFAAAWATGFAADNVTTVMPAVAIATTLAPEAPLVDTATTMPEVAVAADTGTVAPAATIAPAHAPYNWSDPVPDCAVTGQAFTQENLTEVNGAYVHSAAVCQHTCKTTVFCQHFAWDPKSQPYTGACWLYGDKAVQVAKADVVSGPPVCDGTVVNVVSDAAAETAPALVASGASSSGGSSNYWVYGIIAALMGACCVGGGVYAATGKSKKDKKSKKRGLKTMDPEAITYEAPQFQVDADPSYAAVPAMGGAGVQVAQMQPMPQMYAVPQQQYAPVSYTVVQPVTQLVDPGPMGYMVPMGYEQGMEVTYDPQLTA